MPVYAQLRNLIDLSVAAAFIQQQEFCGKAEWNDGHVPATKSNLPVETMQRPAASRARP